MKKKLILRISCILLATFFILSISNINLYSAQTDKLKIFFNDPPDSKNIDIELANFIDTAQKSVNCHFYQLNRQVVVDALLRAAKRLGPQNVKLITDNKYYNPPAKKKKKNTFGDVYSSLEAAGIVILTDDMFGNGGHGESHNKFCVVDVKKVWTGSYNPTDNNTIKDYNNALLIDSEEAAKIYNAEFSNMYDSHLFGAKKPVVQMKRNVMLDSVEIEIYFSPADNVNGKIVDYINKAKQSVSFVIFAFTGDDIEAAFYNRHAAGVNVRGICDNLSAGGKSSGYQALVDKKMNIKKDADSRAQLHDKFTVIDYESNTNAVVITGSHNYTHAANTKNDENIVIIHDKYYAELYYNEFAKIYGAPLIKVSGSAAIQPKTAQPVTTLKTDEVGIKQINHNTVPIQIK